MDLITINVLVSIGSAAAMLAAIIYLLTYILGSFSSKSGAMPLRLVIYSVLYFFGSTIFLFMGVKWLSGLARTGTEEAVRFYLNIGASALALTALLHIICGVLTIALYVKGQISQGLTLQRVLSSVRARMRSKSKK